MKLQWVLKKFDALTPGELYDILQLRNEVFVVEQNCVYQDADNKDKLSYHVSGCMNENDNTFRLVAYTRIVPPGLAFDEVSIGRVVTSPAFRKTGIGKILMIKSIEEATKLYGSVPIQIGAQLYLKKFYSALGFQQISEPYLEDGIEHIEMILNPGVRNSTM